MKFAFTRVSANIKTGPIPTTMTTSDSCPAACPFSPKDGKPNGCYAHYGPSKIHWNRLDKGEKGVDLDGLCDEIRDLPSGQLWRYGVAGDLPGISNDIDGEALAKIVKANSNRKGFGYSHKVVIGHEANSNAIKSANEGGFTINLSANNPDNADELKKLKIAPVVSIVPQNSPNSFFTKGGNKIIICPAQTRKGINCAKCKLCSISNRSVIIGFKAHGTAAKKVETVANL